MGIDVMAGSLIKNPGGGLALTGGYIAGRQDLIEKLNKEIEVLLSYLPEQLSEDEIQKIVEDAIAQTGASTIKDMGKVMGIVTAKAKGRADMKIVGGLVKKMLQGK